MSGFLVLKCSETTKRGHTRHSKTCLDAYTFVRLVHSNLKEILLQEGELLCATWNEEMATSVNNRSSLETTKIVGSQEQGGHFTQAAVVLSCYDFTSANQESRLATITPNDLTLQIRLLSSKFVRGQTLTVPVPTGQPKVTGRDTNQFICTLPSFLKMLDEMSFRAFIDDHLLPEIVLAIKPVSEHSAPKRPPPVAVASTRVDGGLESGITALLTAMPVPPVKKARPSSVVKTSAGIFENVEDDEGGDDLIAGLEYGTQQTDNGGESDEDNGGDV